MSRLLKFKIGRKCNHPRLGEVEMIKWIGRDGISCLVRLKDETECFIKADNYCELRFIK